MSSRSSMFNPNSIRLFLQQLNWIVSDPPPNLVSFTTNDIGLVTTLTLIGPPDSPFQDKVYTICFQYDNQHPFKPPTAYFESPIYHPRVDDKKICLEILKYEYHPTISGREVLN